MTELIPYENQAIARGFIFGCKSCLLMLQTLLVIVVLITKEEYIYRAIDSDLNTDSNKYKTAELVTIITSCVFFAFLLLEFFVVLMGISTKFLKACAFQILLHFWGSLFTLFLIVDRMHYINIVIITVFFGLIPFLIELFVLSYYFFQRKIEQNYIQRPGQRTNLSRDEVIRRKNIEETNIKRSRAQNVDTDMAEVMEQRRQDGKDKRQLDKSADDLKIEDNNNPFEDEKDQYPNEPKEERKGDPQHDNYEEDEYYEDDYPKDGPSLNPNRDYDDDSYSRRNDDYNRHEDDYPESPSRDRYGNSRESPSRPSRGPSHSPERGRPSSPERGRSNSPGRGPSRFSDEKSRGVDLD